MTRTDLTKPGGTTAFAAEKAIPGALAQTGLGVEAVFDPATGTMYVLKGDAMAAVRPGFLADTPAKRLAQATALAALLIPRL